MLVPVVDSTGRTSLKKLSKQDGKIIVKHVTDPDRVKPNKS